MFAQLGRARPLGACVADFAHAYKHMWITSPHLDSAPIAFPEPRGTHMVASSMTQPPGLIRAPASWERVANFAQFVLAKVCKVRMCIYVGDCSCLDPDRAIDPQQFYPGRVRRFWSSVVIGQGKTPARVYNAPGRIFFQNGPTSSAVSRPGRKRMDYGDALRIVRARNSLTHSAAADVRGN